MKFQRFAVKMVERTDDVAVESTGERWRLGHRPALDGLRALAVALVFCRHVHVPGFASAGAVGVTVFFTLSGFLITSLLLEERSARGTFSLRRFYVRRFQRLVPAMLACVLLAVVVELVVSGRIDDWAIIAGTLTYTTNFLMMSQHIVAPTTALGHTWSLAVEEQFYLLWPLLLLAVVKLPRRWRLVLLFYASLGSLLLRLMHWHGGADWQRVYFGLDTHADSLLVGCALAVALHGSRSRTPGRWAKLAAPAGLCVIAGTCCTNLVFADVAGPLVVAVATAAVIYPAVTSDFADFLAGPTLVSVGRRSYGVYLYQGPVLLLTGDGSLWVSFFVALPLLAGVTALSWQYVEQPFLRLKDRQRPAAPSGAPAPSEAVLRGA